MRRVNHVLGVEAPRVAECEAQPLVGRARMHAGASAKRRVLADQENSGSAAKRPRPLPRAALQSKLSDENCRPQPGPAKKVSNETTDNAPSTGSMALGDVWLTMTQEKEIKEAGKAKQTVAPGAAMCAQSDSCSSVGCSLSFSASLPSAMCSEPSVSSPSLLISSASAVTSNACSDPDRASGSLSDAPSSSGLGTSEELQTECRCSFCTSQGAAPGRCPDDLAIRFRVSGVDAEPFLPGGARRLTEDGARPVPYLSSRSESTSKYTAATRQLMVDWAMLRQRRLKLSDATLHLAVHLADEMLRMQDPEKFLRSTRNETSLEARQCLRGWDQLEGACLPAAYRPSKCGMHHLKEPPFPLKLCRLMTTCLFVASKMMDVQAHRPQAKLFAKEAGSEHLGFGSRQLLAAEASLLEAFRYSLVRPITPCFLGAFFSAWSAGLAAQGTRRTSRRTACTSSKQCLFPVPVSHGYLLKRLQCAGYLLDIALLSHTSLKISPSELAAAAFWITCGRGQGAPVARHKLISEIHFKRLTGYGVGTLRDALAFLTSLYLDALDQPHLYVHRKHGDVKGELDSLLMA